MGLEMQARQTEEREMAVTASMQACGVLINRIWKSIQGIAAGMASPQQVCVDTPLSVCT